MLTDMQSTLEIAEGAADNDPDIGLRAVAALRVLAERLEILQVDNARTLGWSWQEIAERLGVTQQTGHRKHGKRTGGRWWPPARAGTRPGSRSRSPLTSTPSGSGTATSAASTSCSP